MTVFPPVELKCQKKDDESRRDFRKRVSGEIYEIMLQHRFLTRDYKKNLFSALLDSARVYGKKRKVLEDITLSPWSYLDLIRRARFLGRYFEGITTQREMVGVLLPNSNMLSAVIYGLFASGRVPVMLNYSQGHSNMEAAMKAAKVKLIISSRGFLEKANLLTLAKSLGDLCFLEDIPQGRLSKLLSLFYNGPLDESKNTAAVVFTSGSEGKPKGVCLSHENILSNILQAKCLIEINEDDCMFNAMPAFHAFGLNIGVILPPLLGLRSFNYISPLHVKTVPELIYDSKATVVLASDSFAYAWAKNANPYDFHTVRFMVLGAEKVKPKTMELFFHKLSVRLFEGYGVTEASPVVAGGSRLRVRDGSVGCILPGIEHRVEKLDGIERGGRLFLKGPNIMLGYLRVERPGEIEPPPDGWYDTGDIVEIDEDGFLWIRGRFKRFSKISGEMVSHSAVEEALLKHFPGTTLSILGIPDELKGERLFLVSAGRTFKRDEVRDAIISEGLTDLSVPKNSLQLENIPLTPLGKVDLPKLEEIVKETLEKASNSEMPLSF
jgi:acyl-[acyl-carrier-protein]-phospholipid O-acyltransferase/long-chain-fatty-acid--[acyl-carrier-protein] ligase